MPIQITSREDKAEQVDLLRKIIQRYLFPGMMNMSAREQVLLHLEWIKRQPEINIECRFETFPELRSTKITLTVSDVPRGPVKHYG